jgi:hypothetical protein
MHYEFLRNEPVPPPPVPAVPRQVAAVLDEPPFDPLDQPA